MLTEQHWKTLEALVNRIVSADEDPDGWDAGVGDYLKRQFSGDLQGRLDDYRAGLDAVEREAQAAGGTNFATLPPSDQDALLTRIEAGDMAAEWPVSPERFFRMVTDHTMEGFYADPGSGGNRNGVAWRMIGFEVRG